MHLDPNIYLMDYENKPSALVEEKTLEANECASTEEGTTANKVNKVSDYLEAIGLAGSVSEIKNG